jgi:SAM-dependent methyltransferase
MLPGATPYVLRHVEKLLEHAGFKPGSRILDIGCGMGRFSFLLAERGYQVESLDVSQFMIDRLQEFDGGRFNIRTWCVDLAEMPPEIEGRFDGVAGFFMLHHFTELQKALGPVARLLRPGGTAAFIEPNPYNPLFYIQVLSRPDMKWEAEKGMMNLTPGKIKRTLTESGLKDLTLERYGFLPPFLRNTSWGGAVERVAEAIPPMRPTLPFQVITCRKPA